MKSAALKLMRMTGAFDVFRLLHRRQALILTYHRFGASDDGSRTSPQSFRTQLDYITSKYRVVTLTEMLSHLSKDKALPEGLAAITIDDGYRDAYEIAYPILRHYGAPATLYVATDFVERRTWLWTDKMRFIALQAAPQNISIEIGGMKLEANLSGKSSRLLFAEKANSLLKKMEVALRDEILIRLSRELASPIPNNPPDDLSAIGWDHAREMSNVGIEIGSHTVTHPIMTYIDQVQMAFELNESRAMIEGELKRPVAHFCYPNGNYDERAQKEVQIAGYVSAVTCDDGFNQELCNPFTLKRVHTEQDLTHFLQSTSGFEHVKNRIRNANAASAKGSAGVSFL